MFDKFWSCCYNIGITLDMVTNMSYLYDQKVGNKKYVYLITGYRDQSGKVRQNRKIVGKVDPASGNRIFKSECIELIRSAGIDIPYPQDVQCFSVEDIKKSSVRSFGYFHLLKNIGYTSGLITSLKAAFPDNWQEIFMLSCYMIISRDPTMYCADWLTGSDSFPVKNMSSQRISELLAKMTLEQRNTFYQIWCERNRKADDYLALDITSVSSYSSGNEAVEWGHNRDGEALPQINLCMLMAEKSRLPLFQTSYSGSLSDVRTLKTTLHRFEAITGSKNITIITDKGFASQKNIRMLLDTNGDRPVKFLMAMPFSSNLVKNLVDVERNTIDGIQNTLIINGESLRAKTKVIQWENTTTGLHAHIYYNPMKAAMAKEKLYAAVFSMLEKAKESPLDYIDNKDFLKYLSFSKKNDGTYQIFIRSEAVEDSLRYSGWLVLLSNRFTNAKTAMQVYRDKDVVEKGFCRLKNSIELGRLRVHGNMAMEGKLFIGFIASILLCVLNNGMVDNGFYSAYTMTEMLKILEKQRVQIINKQEIIFPSTKEQRTIYEAFGVPLPD